MRKAIFYGTTTFTTEDVAYKLQEKVKDAEVFNVIDGIDNMEDFDLIYICTPTYGRGELEDHWADVIEELENKDLSSKYVALLGTGDSIVHGDSFVNTLSSMYEILEKTNCTFLGNRVSVDDYSFEESTAIREGYFIGLPIDEMNEYELTEDRIDRWINQIEEQL